MKYGAIHKYAKQKHEGQVDKAGAPYFEHPQRVANMIFDFFDTENVEDPRYRTDIFKFMSIALLHDVLEDTDTTIDEFRELGIEENIINGVLSVTRQENESYGDFVKRASENEYGLIVKFFDLQDNLDITRLKKLDEKDLNRINKYLKWYHYLKTIIIKKYPIVEYD